MAERGDVGRENECNKRTKLERVEKSNVIKGPRNADRGRSLRY